MQQEQDSGLSFLTGLPESERMRALARFQAIRPFLEEMYPFPSAFSLADGNAVYSEIAVRPEALLAQGMRLLETVSTAFQGLSAGAGTIQGKYFNKIAADLSKHQRGRTVEQVLSWMTTLHGYLSSPTGGGIRHGTNLNAGIPLHADEARLFCNLIAATSPIS